jgi:hypothetical protein
LFAEHPDFDGSALIGRLIERVTERLSTVFGRSEYEVINLDATTPRKFSRHLIIRAAAFCFRNNAHAGQFVQREIMTVPELAAIVDMAVYSKNRNFRCIWSTKCANVEFPLLPVDGTNRSPAMSTAEVFRKTLICEVGEKPTLIGYPELEKPTVERVVRPTPARGSEAFSGSAVDEFAIGHLAVGGWITRRKFNAEIDALNLMVEGTRFCRRIGREHRSNHIYISCRLDLGIMMQKCTDPDCRGFQSEAVEIPAEMLEELRNEYIPGRTFSSQKVKKANTETVDIEAILADYEDVMDDIHGD